VLPFQNMSGDPEQEYFTDGMVEEIITALSRIRWLFACVVTNGTPGVDFAPGLDVRRLGQRMPPFDHLVGEAVARSSG